MQFRYDNWFEKSVFELMITNKNAWLEYIIEKKTSYLVFINNYFFVYLFILICCTSCINTQITNTEAYRSNQIITKISKKIDECNLTYQDIFENDYQNFNEKDQNNANILDNIVKKLKQNVKQNCSNQSNCNNRNAIDVDAILEGKIEEITNKIIQSENLKYGIYGTDETRWFIKDETLKAPLNYFQQQFLLQASTEMLKKMTCIMVRKMVSGDRIYDTNYGSFWVVYGRGNKFKEGFEILQNVVNEIKEKAKTQKLSQKDINILKTLINMKKFENIKTDTIGEYFSKMGLVSKSKEIIDIAENVLNDNNLI